MYYIYMIKSRKKIKQRSRKRMYTHTIRRLKKSIQRVGGYRGYKKAGSGKKKTPKIENAKNRKRYFTRIS